jgi:hypothetical protein
MPSKRPPGLTDRVIVEQHIGKVRLARVSDHEES